MAVLVSPRQPNPPSRCVAARNSLYDALETIPRWHLARQPTQSHWMALWGTRVSWHNVNWRKQTPHWNSPLTHWEAVAAPLKDEHLGEWQGYLLVIPSPALERFETSTPLQHYAHMKPQRCPKIIDALMQFARLRNSGHGHVRTKKL